MSNTLNRDIIRTRLQANYHNDLINGDAVVAGISTPAHLQTNQASLQSAAVLVPIIEHGSYYTILLTQRSEHLSHHAGQISFPGGRCDEDDADATATALREAQEEIGLAADKIDILGYLERYQTGTGFLVTPVVGLIQPPLRLQLEPFEVESVFEVPLSFIMDRNHHQLDSRIFQGQRRQYYAIPYQNHYIWGATAAMLVSLVQVLSD